MHDVEKRKVAWFHFQQGKGKKEIARLLGIDVKTVKRFIKHKGELPKRETPSRIELNEEEIRTLHGDCQGYVRRMHEILTEERGAEIAYSTLTRRVRELGLDDNSGEQCCADGELLVKPGDEMQNDTSQYTVKLGGRECGVIAAGLYYRFTKNRYLKFYLSFDRFAMKCFFHEALTFWEYSADTCIIDNTHLAVLHGTGRDAVMAPEMKAFASRYRFKWKAHALGHSNRKAGKERNFWTLETNFFPGRKFANLDDLNAQAKKWATERFFRKPHDKTKLVPAEQWEIEKPFLKKIPELIEPPYREHGRDTDRKGYVQLRANYYLVPDARPHEPMRLIEYPDRVKIFRRHELVIDYQIAPEDARGFKRRPPGSPDIPERAQNEKTTSDEEDKKLRATGTAAIRYLDWLAANPGRVRYRHQFVRELYGLSRRLAPSITSAALEQAYIYGIAGIDSIERIAAMVLRSSPQESDVLIDLPSPNYEYLSRESYREGRFSEEADLSTLAHRFEPPEEEKPSDKQEGKDNDDKNKGK